MRLRIDWYGLSKVAMPFVVNLLERAELHLVEGDTNAPGRDGWKRSELYKIGDPRHRHMRCQL